jgi:Flp pilus assembly protein TadB
VVDAMTVGAALIGGAAVAVLSGPSPARCRLAAIAPRVGRAAPGRGEVLGRGGVPVRFRVAGRGEGSDRSRATALGGRRADRPEQSGSGRPATLGAGSRSGLSSRPAQLVAGGVAALGVGVVMGGVLGLVAGFLVGGLLIRWVGRLEPSARAREADRMEAHLPLVADLLSAAIAAGAPPDRAAHLVGSAVGGPLGVLLVAGADRAALGGNPTTAWRELAKRPVTARLGGALATSGERGAAPAETLGRVADDTRDSARWSAEARARALGARAAAPLGLCFLPAFLLVGVAPVVAAAGSLLP